MLSLQIWIRFEAVFDVSGVKKRLNEWNKHEMMESKSKKNWNETDCINKETQRNLSHNQNVLFYVTSIFEIQKYFQMNRFWNILLIIVAHIFWNEKNLFIHIILKQWISQDTILPRLDTAWLTTWSFRK